MVALHNRSHVKQVSGHRYITSSAPLFSETVAGDKDTLAAPFSISMLDELKLILVIAFLRSTEAGEISAVALAF